MKAATLVWNSNNHEGAFPREYIILVCSRSTLGFHFVTNSFKRFVLKFQDIIKSLNFTVSLKILLGKILFFLVFFF